MQSNFFHCAARRPPCDARPLVIATTHSLRGLGFTSCVRGTKLSLARPNRTYLGQPKTLQRRQVVQAFVVPHALIRIAQKVVFRGASGKLLFETAKKGGWRLAAPLTFLLFIYSVVATWVAAWQTKRAQKLLRIADGSGTCPENATNVASFASTSSTADSGASLSAETPIAAADACPICHGRGTITWDRFETKEGALCPRCLGTGTTKKRSSFFGK